MTLSQLLDVDHEPGPADASAERLGRLLASLARNAKPGELERFERVLRAFFDAGKPRRAKPRRRR